MRNQYLLYIDILGFEEMVAKAPDRVDDVFRIIASLNAHRHPDFSTIVFSDTILVHSAAVPRSEHDHDYIVMYLCEFAQDLLRRLVGREIAFRAVITMGEFDHYLLNDVAYFYGQALLGAYKAEKKIKCTGLFIDGVCNRRNRIFPTASYDDDWHFVFLTQRLTELEDVYEGELPLDDRLVADTDFCPLVSVL